MPDDRAKNALVLEAIRLQNSGHHQRAAQKFQDAGNQYRSPADKVELWAAADRARRVALSD
ncbi:hypothetical protein LOC51_00595 [Rubrivivax sp. JA1024]|nr:hypothetical protein [Rubrivivax sp. JA1024]